MQNRKTFRTAEGRKLMRALGAAERLNVTLPAALVEAAAFDLDMPPIIELREQVRDEIREAMGARDFRKRRDAALARLAAAEAIQPLRGRLDDDAERYAWSVAREHSGEILAAFAGVLAPVVETLNEAAPKIPERAVSHEDTARLNPDQFAAFHAAMPAAEALVTAAVDLAAFTGAGLYKPSPTSSFAVAPANAARVAVLSGVADLDREERAVLAHVVFTDNRRTGDYYPNTHRPANWVAVAADLGMTFTAPRAAKATSADINALIDSLREEPAPVMTVAGKVL